MDKLVMIIFHIKNHLEFNIAKARGMSPMAFDHRLNMLTICIYFCHSVHG